MSQSPSTFAKPVSSIPPAEPRAGFGALLLILLAWLGTYFPWVAAGVTAFSVNLYDLAEWSSLNPAVRAGTFPLLATFCLRAAVGLLAFRLTLQAAANGKRWLRWAIRALALLIGIGLLPPLDFFRGAFADPNYRQQFIIALVSSIAILAAWRTPWDWHKQLRYTLLSALSNWFALAFSVVGVVIGLQALSQLGLHVSYGPGAGLTLIAEGVLILATVF